MNILETIVEHKREEIAGRKQKVRVSGLADLEFYGRTVVSLRHALRRSGGMAIIAEIKRASPAAGILRHKLDPAEVAREYSENGAAAVSVLTDERFFSGSLADLKSVRNVTSIPLLRKDFIIDEYQLHEAKAYGADAVLIIAGILDRSHLSELHDAARELGLESLVELHEAGELKLLDPDRMLLVGVNNRDLRTFAVDLDRTFTIARQLASVPEITIVSESGIRDSDDLKKLLAGGIRAALIGTTLLKSPSPGEALRELLAGLKHAAAD
ncbi:MAG TPA: indole-3-glycerol phosphate synthase TrpC [Bacteroidota bacterium]|nr:indole-3-glycerol phosphate synthase TrpC [Bacteroidota bacterium]